MNRVRLYICIYVITILILALNAQTVAAEGITGNGEELFDLHCSMCHDIETVSEKGHSLIGVTGRMSDAEIREVTKNGRDTVPLMPAFGGRLSEEDIDEIINYLHAVSEKDGSEVQEIDMVQMGMKLLWISVLFLLCMVGILIYYLKSKNTK